MLECFPIGKEKPALRAWKKEADNTAETLPCSQGSPSETHTKTCTCSRPISAQRLLPEWASWGKCRCQVFLLFTLQASVTPQERRLQ